MCQVIKPHESFVDFMNDLGGYTVTLDAKYQKHDKSGNP